MVVKKLYCDLLGYDNAKTDKWIFTHVSEKKSTSILPKSSDNVFIWMLQP